jgi:hypothetical protein
MNTFEIICGLSVGIGFALAVSGTSPLLAASLFFVAALGLWGKKI